MTAVDELAELYAQWQVLTEQEGTAIRQTAWASVEQCQAAKGRLQPRIEELSGRVEPAVLESRLRRLIDELIRLEQRNAALLAEYRAAAEAEIHSASRSCRQLRHLQKLYIPPARQNWQSYS